MYVQTLRASDAKKLTTIVTNHGTQQGAINKQNCIRPIGPALTGMYARDGNTINTIYRGLIVHRNEIV